MRAQDIINQLAVLLPSLVNDFTDQIAVSSLTRAGTTVTVTTSAAHGLVVGAAVNVTGAITPITISSLTRVGIQGTLVTAADHDMTEDADFSVVIEGATESEFNGTFTLLKVLNRRTVTFVMADSGATTATGSPLLLSGSSPLQSYNGLKDVTVVPDTVTFEYEVTDTTLFTPASGTIVAKTAPRISGAVDIERAFDSYTAQPPAASWLFVVLGDAVANKNKNIDTDATNNLQRGQFQDQRIIQAVSVYLFSPASDEIAARVARDRAQELFGPICQSIVMGKFDSQLSTGSLNPLQMNGHGFQAYTTATYVHRYDFEVTEQLAQADVFEPTDDVAFRDISLRNTLAVGTQEDSIDSEIDLDEVILP